MRKVWRWEGPRWHNPEVVHLRESIKPLVGPPAFAPQVSSSLYHPLAPLMWDERTQEYSNPVPKFSR